MQNPKTVKVNTSKLVLIEGLRGSGKSLLLTWLLLNSKLPFYSNFKVYADKQKTKFHKRYNELHPEELLNLKISGCNAGITEAYEFFESRLGMGAFQRYMSYIVFQSRKRKINFFIDTQLDDTIDHRFRRLCDYVIVAEAEKTGFHYYCTDRKVINEFGFSFKQAERFWDYYDSWEVVMTPQIEDLGKQIEVSNKPKLKQKLNELEKIFFETYGEIPQRKITHSMIDGFLLDLEPPESDVYAPFLYARLQKPKSNK